MARRRRDAHVRRACRHASTPPLLSEPVHRARAPDNRERQLRTQLTPIISVSQRDEAPSAPAHAAAEREERKARQQRCAAAAAADAAFVCCAAAAAASAASGSGRGDVGHAR